MNPNQGPVGPQFKDESLQKKFSYSFTRGQLIILVNALRQIQAPIADMRGRVLTEIYDEIERTAVQSITPDDYVQPEKPADKPLPEVATN